MGRSHVRPQTRPLLAASVLLVACASLEDITPLEVEEAQQAWGRRVSELAGLLGGSYAISPESMREHAIHFVDRLYGHAFQPLLFRSDDPTPKPFRASKEGVVSFLVGGDEEFPEDVGFLRRGLRRVRFENVGISLVGGQAMAMGSCFLEDPDGNETRLEYSMGYFRAPGGRLRLNLHFLSRPFANCSNETWHMTITQEEVEAAQKAWGDSVIEIGHYHERGWHYLERTRMFVDSMYAYDIGTVLFKPAEASEEPFRTTRAGAIAYFVGDEAFPKDPGFALNAWKEVHFHNAGFILEKNQAWVEGTYIFTGGAAGRIQAQYAFGYVRDEEGRLRLNLFHTSFPHNSQKWGGWKAKESENITELAVEAAQKAWADGIVEIGDYYTMKGDFRRRAAEFVDSHYAYSVRPVLFKPAEATAHPFRTSREGAISYLVGGNPRFPEDWGFALRPWKRARFSNEGVVIIGDQALAMGRLVFNSAGGLQREAEYTMGFVQDAEGSLRINLHHVAFPNITSRTDDVAAASPEPVSQGQVVQAQKVWGDNLIEIGKLHANSSLARKLAKSMVDKLYGYNEGPVLFKPIEATAATRFRLTRAGAISWFVGGDPDFPRDLGFAMRPWRQVSARIAAISVEGNRAQAMGNYFFCCDAKGKKLKMEYSLGYLRGVDGRLRIDLHYISIPYEANYNSTWDNVSKVAAAEAAAAAKGVAAAAGSTGKAIGAAAQGLESGAGVLVGDVASAGGGVVSAGAAGGSHTLLFLGMGIVTCGIFSYFTIFLRKGAGGPWDMIANRGSELVDLPASAFTGGTGQSQRPMGEQPGGYLQRPAYTLVPSTSHGSATSHGYYPRDGSAGAPLRAADLSGRGGEGGGSYYHGGGLYGGIQHPHAGSARAVSHQSSYHYGGGLASDAQIQQMLAAS
mmetsp:Transcript_92468/g.205390  ORF Transcript_92468/g.205390 Transcript_92468/m.205390 type:complete len:909 (-) Transcript_92468:34-2760(-)